MKRAKLNERVKSIIVLIVVWFSVIAVYYINLTQFAGENTKRVSGKFDAQVLVTPAPYVFVIIWFLIYAGLLAFAVYQALPAQLENPRVKNARLWVSLNTVLNLSWTILFNSQNFAGAWTVIVGILATALIIHRKLEIGGAAKIEVGEILMRVTFSLYTGWSCVATIAYTSFVLNLFGWNGFGIAGAEWAVIMLRAGAVISLACLYALNDFVLSAVFVWAYVGVAFRQQETALVSNTAYGLSILIALAILFGGFNRLKAASGGKYA
ncbi:MAG TPA: hypothetical protein VF556_13760 [Pyrinomonadaceae bacterium]|jgi:hypothetical protein